MTVLERVKTNEEVEFELLSLATHKRKFAIQLGYPFSPQQQEAFERGIDNEWYTFVDVGHVTAAPGRLMRVFRLTDAGMTRLAELSNRFQTKN